MSKIRVLPDSLANKIAAGEVVERPSSVVKELLENALDAGARKVSIEVEAGGKRLISVVDDGEGMTRDDAITAFERHATSKLRTADDLETITTLGFRGEALPSIASVSRLFLRTKTASDVEGTEVEFNGSRLVAVRDIAWPGGSEVEVKDLFFNIPARRKFLKSDATESFHITNLVQHYALANPETSFLLINNGREAIRVSAARSLRERAYQVLGGPLVGKLVEVNKEFEDLRLIGFVSNPQEQRSSRDAQYLFVNHRFVRDQLIGRALVEAYRSMMPSGTYPAAILFVELPPTEVDVNVHPAKTEVRFLREGAILSFIRDSVADALRSTQPVTRVPSPGAATRGQSDRSAERLPAYPQYTPPRIDRAPVTSYDVKESPPAVDSPAAHALRAPRDAQEHIDSAINQPTAAEEQAEQAISNEAVEYQQLEKQALPGLGHGIKPLGQIRDSYIVATDEEGLLLVDQHAAHERVLFEEIRDGRLARGPQVQQLLIPETLDLSPAEAQAFAVVREELDNLGVETMELSGRTIAVKTAPAGLASSDVIQLVREALSVVERERRDFNIENVRDQMAASLACKAAIKVNMPLTSEKMQWLIDELMKTNNPMTCPHGRPSIMRMQLRDIERGFKRPV
jgi:DNA mismatch repair protein MutL